MSTLNSYFNTRKSRANVAQHEKTDVETSKACAIQAPQPVYESLKIINTKPKNRLSAIEKKNQPDAQRNNILNYLSPVRKCAVQCNKATVEAEEEEYTHTLCKIRVNIPVSHVWSNILEEFDPKSQINQFADLVFEDKTEEVLDKERNTNSLIVGRRRTRDVIEDQVDVTRVSRIDEGFINSIVINDALECTYSNW